LFWAFVVEIEEGFLTPFGMTGLACGTIEGWVRNAPLGRAGRDEPKSRQAAGATTSTTREIACG
jgi:hypothetical protein